MSSNKKNSLFILFSLLLFSILDSAYLTVLKSCPSHCGGINIPYPFGIGRGCYFDKWYEIECKHTSNNSGKLAPFLSVISREVVSISLPVNLFNDELQLRRSMERDGSVRIKNPITSKGCSEEEEELGSLLNLTGTPFNVSTNNILIASGCNNTASLTNVEPSLVGCKSSCDDKYHMPTKVYLAVISCHRNKNRYNISQYPNCNTTSIRSETSCNGNRCCKANMPLTNQKIVGVKIDDTTTTGGCKVALLTDEAYVLSNGSDPQRLLAKRYATVELVWFMDLNGSFVKSLGCYDLKAYSHLTYVEASEIKCVCVAKSYSSYDRCSCSNGYEGNPYIPGGCKDIDECLTHLSHCHGGTCVNLQGYYDCVHTNHHRPLSIGLGSSFGSLIFVGGIYLLYTFIKKQRRLRQKKKFFKRNGGLLLQQQLISTEGNVEKTKLFSSGELDKATENFSLKRILGQGGQGTLQENRAICNSRFRRKTVANGELRRFCDEFRFVATSSLQTESCRKSAANSSFVAKPSPKSRRICNSIAASFCGCFTSN